MTVNEFNEKYKNFLKESYGLDINDERVISYLDDIFENELININGFAYSQIKLKFNSSRFYGTGLSLEKINEIEQKINDILND
jgi:hypothetical protein